ncbi:hypothetical protein U1Q18_043710 [Sarracenia purpurea var. burkii]
MEAVAITLVRRKQWQLLRQIQSSQLRSGYTGDVSTVVIGGNRQNSLRSNRWRIDCRRGALIFLFDSKKHRQLQVEEVSGSDK